MVTQTPPALSVNAISKRYIRRETYSGRRCVFDALKSVSLTLAPGSITGIVGQSGSGKSTLARILAGLEPPDAGSVFFGDIEIGAFGERSLRAIRPRIQLMFQDSAMALNPRFSIEDLVEEPLKIQQRGTPQERRERVRELLGEVGLDAAMATRRARQLSGGQRQRVALARALALNPEVLLLDESLSALDLLTQQNMLKLIMELHARHGFTCLFISHDLRLVLQMAEQVLVMYRGEIVERGPGSVILAKPQHPHTMSLVAAVQQVQSACAAVMGQ